MSKTPAIPFFVDAHLGDTLFLSESQEGIYLRLLMSMWQMKGSLPDDDDVLARFARVPKAKWLKKYRPVLKRFFIICDGFWIQKRLKKEWEYVTSKAEKNRKNGAQGGRPKSLKGKETAKANGSFSDNPDANRSGNPEETQTESPSTYTIERTDVLSSPSSPPGEMTELKPLDEISQAVNAWNELAGECDLPKVRDVSAQRRKQLTERLKECGGIEGWMWALEKVRSTPGLQGKAGGSWRATFDFLLRKSSFTKLMEGNYDGWTDKRESYQPANGYNAAPERRSNRDNFDAGFFKAVYGRQASS